jgi:hypothetical protein
MRSVSRPRRSPLLRSGRGAGGEGQDALHPVSQQSRKQPCLTRTLKTEPSLNHRYSNRTFKRFNVPTLNPRNSNFEIRNGLIALFLFVFFGTIQFVRGPLRSGLQPPVRASLFQPGGLPLGAQGESVARHASERRAGEADEAAKRRWGETRPYRRGLSWTRGWASLRTAHNAVLLDPREGGDEGFNVETLERLKRSTRVAGASF